MNNRQRSILNGVIGQKNLLAIGVNSYSDHNFNNLERACNDASAVFEKFKQVRNLNLNIAKSKLLISDEKNKEATKAKVKKRKQTGQPCYIAPNLFNRDFVATAPLQKLVTDITYLPFGQKQLYLSSIQDLYNGEIIAYSIGERQDTDFVLHTLAQLNHVPEGCTLHSDQGSVYTSYRYQQAVKGKGITMSMSRKGTPSDNAPIESFHSALKSETFYLDNLKRTTTAIVEQTVKDYINYYNYIRIQTKLNNQSPVQCRQLVG